jgi:DNA end-binding protein Ku
MLLPISGGGKRGAKETAKPEPKKAEKPARTTAARSKKAG